MNWVVWRTGVAHRWATYRSGSWAGATAIVRRFVAIVTNIVKLEMTNRLANAVLRAAGGLRKALFGAFIGHCLKVQPRALCIARLHTCSGICAVTIDVCLRIGTLRIAQSLTPSCITTMVIRSRFFQVGLAIAIVLSVVAVPMSAFRLRCITLTPLLPIRRPVEPNIIANERVVRMLACHLLAMLGDAHDFCQARCA